MKCNNCEQHFDNHIDYIIHKFTVHGDKCICCYPEWRSYGLEFLSSKIVLNTPNTRTIEKIYVCMYCYKKWKLSDIINDDKHVTVWEQL